MKFAKWIVLIAFFAFAENAPVTEKPWDEHDVIYILSKLTFQVINYIGAKGGNAATRTVELEGNVVNVTALTAGGYAEQQFRPQNNIQIKIHLNVSMDVYLRDFNHHFITEVFPADVGITWDNGTAKAHFPDVDNFNLKLLPNDYQYKPNEEENVKQKIKSLIKNIIEKKFTEEGEYMKSLRATFRFIEADNSHQLNLLSNKPPYSLAPFSSTNYELNNLTIHGLWHVQSISYNLSNVEVSPQVVVGHVTGSVVQKFHSKADEPLELSFNADNIRLTMNQKDSYNVNVRISGFALKNNKTNSPLGDDESKLIAKEIESAIAASDIVTDWKKYIRVTFEHTVPNP